MELIKGEWWTDTTVTTDENGFVTVEGFKGTYELLAGDKKADLTLSVSEEEPVTITLR